MHVAGDVLAVGHPWLGKDLQKNEEEIACAVNLANQHHNVDSVIVGNEVLLRQDLPEDQLLDYIVRVTYSTIAFFATGGMLAMRQVSAPEMPATASNAWSICSAEGT